MLSEKLLEEINTQINKELYSAYLYLAMAAYFEGEGMSGFAGWMKVQAQEETFHALKFFNHVNERGGKVVLQPIEGPPAEWDSPLAVFEYTLEHERFVTGRINLLLQIAREENDYASESFLKWYVDEQVEEEASAAAIIDKLRLVGEMGGGLFMLDKELGSRVFTPPVAEQ